MLKKNVFIVGIVFLIIIAVVAAGVLGGFFPRERVIVPHITPGTLGTAPIIAQHEFPFEQSIITISVPVNRSVFDGARSSDKSITIFGNVSENIWMADSYRAMAGDPAQEELYQSLIAQFRNVKSQMGLSDDEYIELLAAYVQSMKYETTAQNPAKFPVETVVDGAGDCDDKSLLLAGLLSHENYNVALLSFGPEAHMATGIASDAYLYKNTNYTFIETTNFSYIGVATGTLENGVTLTSDPVVIPIGAGSKIYNLGRETEYIDMMQHFTEKNAKDLEAEMASMEQDLKSRHTTVVQLEQKMAVSRGAGDIGGYNAMVSEHNARVSEYNSRLEQYRLLHAQYERYATTYNYIISHEYDRKGVFDFIKNNFPS